MLIENEETICKAILISAKISIIEAHEYLKLEYFLLYIYKGIPQRQTELLD